MTLANANNRIQYTADGSEDTYPFPYGFFEDADIVAILTDTDGNEDPQELGTDFTIDGEADLAGAYPDGADIVFNVAPPNGYLVTIYRQVALTQSTDLEEGDPLPSNVLEQTLDRIVAMIQQGAETFGRTITLAVSSIYSNLTMPDPEAGLFLRWKTDLSGLENAEITDLGSVGLPLTVAQGGTEADNAADARANLDVMQNVFTARGDLVRRGATAEERLGVGAGGRVLRSNGTDPSWSTATVTSAKSDDYTVVDNDEGTLFLVSSSAGDKTITLPAAPSTNMKVGVKKVDSGNKVIVSGNGKNINGLASINLQVQYDYAWLIYDGDEWFILDERRRYVSGDLTITASGDHDLTHGLGVSPANVELYLKCLEDNAGYTAGEELLIQEGFIFADGQGTAGVGVTVSNTNLKLTIGSRTSESIAIIHKSTHVQAGATNTKWALIVRALA